MSEDCIFCEIVAKKIPSKIILEEKNFVAFQDVNPQAPVHFLVVPRVHIESIDAVKDNELILIGQMVKVAKQLAHEIKLKGYRLVFNNGREAGQSVFHIHLHVLGGRPMLWPPG
ncbi:MAG: histidine triad nucleotide-binding protein [Candidatus Omnitrophica bacterium]|nr:histidine triad nucleotide-binding protein [Candidatus Omnitrophota bacterium]